MTPLIARLRHLSAAPSRLGDVAATVLRGGLILLGAGAALLATGLAQLP